MQSLDRHIYLYFYSSFINAGLQNVIPQVFFSEHYPHQEALLLSICLLVGAASSIATIWMTRTYRMANVAIRKQVVWLQLAGIVIFLASLWLWQTAVLYIVSFMILRALVQALFNRVDHYYVAITPSQHMASFARSSTLFRLIGIMAGPFYFALIYPYVGFNIGMIFILSAVLLWSFSSMLTSAPLHLEAAASKETNQDQDRTYTRQAKSTRQSIFFVVYLLTATTGVYVFSSNILMIVRDLYGVSSAVAKSGILLLLMNATGIATVALWPVLRKKIRVFSDKQPSYSGQTTYAALFLGCVSLLKWPIILSYTFLLVLSMFTGAVYGLFWMKTREFAIQDPEGKNKQWMLTLYNNANNFSILFASVVLLVVASLSAQWGGSYLAMITTALIVCFAVSTLYAIRLDLQTKKNREERV